jgi:tRNA-dependent cyclodipeptide synthase
MTINKMTQVETTDICNPDRTGGLAGAMMFIPISLGNHFYSSQVLTVLLQHFVTRSHQSVIFLCDRLRFLSYEIRGEANSQRINTNIRLQLDQLTRSLMNNGLNSHENVKVANWSYLDGDSRFGNLVMWLQRLLRDDPRVGQLADDYAMSLLARFGQASGKSIAPRRSIKLQHQYIIEETALSLYMTELKGFNTEIYRKGMGFIDDLYTERRADLMSFLGKRALERRFVSIESCLNGHGVGSR